MTTNTAKKINDTITTNDTTINPKDDSQLDALDSLPTMFPDTPTVDATKAAIVQFAQDGDKSLEDLREAAFAEKVKVENALKSDSRAEFAKAMSKAQTACKAYNDALLTDHFGRFLLDAEPMQAFMRQGFYKKLAISTSEGKEGTTISVKESDAVLPLARFVTYAGDLSVVRSKSWQHYVQRVTALLSIRAAQDIGHDVTEMLKDFAMDEAARGMVKKDVNPREKNPISNGTLVDAMQDMLDRVLYIANEKKMNTYRVVSSTLHYFLYIAFRRGSKPGTIAAPKASTIEKYLVEMGHLMVNGANFRMEYEKVKAIESNAA